MFFICLFVFCLFVFCLFVFCLFFVCLFFVCFFVCLFVFCFLFVCLFVCLRLFVCLVFYWYLCSIYSCSKYKKGNKGARILKRTQALKTPSFWITLYLSFSWIGWWQERCQSHFDMKTSFNIACSVRIPVIFRRKGFFQSNSFPANLLFKYHSFWRIKHKSGN